MIKYKVYTITRLLLTAMLCSFITSTSIAQSDAKGSEDEDIIIAFYKTGKAIPNFDKWIKRQELYINAPWGLQDKVYDKELRHLKSKYVRFKPNKDLLIIKTKSNLDLSTTTNDEGETQYFLKSKFSTAPDALYFPFDYNDERIVVMPYSLERFLNHEITKGDYDYIQHENFGQNGVTTILRMSAHESDMSRPYKIDGIEQWVLKTKIATIEYWAKDRLIYEYSAPTYLSPNTQDLQNLYKDRPTGSKIQKGIVKPMPSFENKSRE